MYCFASHSNVFIQTEHMLDVYHSVGIHQMYKHVHSHLDALGSSAWNTNFLALLLYLHLHASTAVNTAPIMTSFGSCRGPGAAKWDYTAGYFVRSQWRGSACKGGHTIGMLIDWFDSLRGSPSSKTPCHWKHLSEPMEEKLSRTSVVISPVSSETYGEAACVFLV